MTHIRLSEVTLSWWDPYPLSVKLTMWFSKRRNREVLAQALTFWTSLQPLIHNHSMEEDLAMLREVIIQHSQDNKGAPTIRITLQTTTIPILVLTTRPELIITTLQQLQSQIGGNTFVIIARYPVTLSKGILKYIGIHQDTDYITRGEKLLLGFKLTLVLVIQ